MACEENVPGFQLAFVPFCIELGNPKTSQGRDEAVGGRGVTTAGKGQPNRAGGEERTDSSDGKRACAGEPTHQIVGDRVRVSSGSHAFAFRPLLLISGLLRTESVRDQNRNVRIAEARAPDLSQALLDGIRSWEDSGNGNVLIHLNSPIYGVLN